MIIYSYIDRLSSSKMGNYFLGSHRHFQNLHVNVKILKLLNKIQNFSQGNLCCYFSSLFVKCPAKGFYQKTLFKIYLHDNYPLGKESENQMNKILLESSHHATQRKCLIKLYIYHLIFNSIVTHWEADQKQSILWLEVHTLSYSVPSWPCH